jgi:hypothetical protein
MEAGDESSKQAVPSRSGSTLLNAPRTTPISTPRPKLVTKQVNRSIHLLRKPVAGTGQQSTAQPEAANLPDPGQNADSQDPIPISTDGRPVSGGSNNGGVPTPSGDPNGLLQNKLQTEVGALGR